jgi:hypothetical protein
MCIWKGELSAAGISVGSCCTKELYEEEEKGKRVGEGLSFMSREQGHKATRRRDQRTNSDN